jgi:hypothetical protein
MQPRYVIINYPRITSKKGAYITLWRDDIVTLLQEKKLVKIDHRVYVFMSVIMHPIQQKPVLIPKNSYEDTVEIDGKPTRKPYPGRQETDHNPDIHGLTGSKE